MRWEGNFISILKKRDRDSKKLDGIFVIVGLICHRARTWTQDSRFQGWVWFSRCHSACHIRNKESWVWKHSAYQLACLTFIFNCIFILLHALYFYMLSHILWESTRKENNQKRKRRRGEGEKAGERRTAGAQILHLD